MKQANSRRSESTNTFIYLVVGVIIIVVLLFGSYAIASINERICKTELASFQLKMQDLDKQVQFASVKERALGMPCKTELVLFVDRSKAQPELFDNPFVRDSVDSDDADDAFLFKDNALSLKFDTGELDLRHPGFVCLRPLNGELEFLIEGRRNGVAILNGCLQPDCTYFSPELSEGDVEAIIQEFIDFGFYEPDDCPSCPVNLKTELRNYENTKNYIDVLRRFTYCADSGITTVEIVITPTGSAALDDFRFYEFIPKQCVDDLTTYLVGAIEGDVSVKADPLIMWEFGLLKKKQGVSYQLSRDLDDQCRQLIKGLGVAQFFTGGPPTPRPRAPLTPSNPGTALTPEPPASPSATPLPAVLSATHSNLQQNTGAAPPGWSAGQNWWYYDVTLQETSGNSGITVQSIQKCYDSPGPPPTNWCDAINTNVIADYGTSYIPAGGAISPLNRQFVYFSPGFRYTTTARFNGIDDNNNVVQGTHTFNVIS